MKTNHSSLFIFRHLPFVPLAALAVCLVVLPVRAQGNYWGQALSFDGVTNCLTIGAEPLTESWTAEFWVNRQASTNFATTLLDDGVTSLRLEQYNDTHLVGFTSYGDADYTFDYSAPVDTWVHLAFVSDMVHTYLYVNGVAQSTNEYTIPLPLREFGASDTGSGRGAFLKGAVDEIRIWNMARSAEDIQRDMFQAPTGSEPGLVICYRFDEGSGLIAHDATANHFDATLVNDPTWIASTAPFPFTYTTNGGTTITITGYTGSGGAVTIPSTINGLPVVGFGDYAFSYCYNVTNIVIPEGVVFLGSGAFFNCAGLTNVILPNSLINIGDAAFNSCWALAEIRIPMGVTHIGAAPFMGCTSLKSITVDAANPAYSSADGVLFDKNLTMLLKCPVSRSGDYVIPDGVTWISTYAFDQCSGLTSVIIPDGVINIEFGAFGGCAGLTNVTVPASVTSIANEPFVNCHHLQSIAVDANNPAYCSVDGVLFDKNHTTLIQFPGGKAGKYTVLAGVTTIIRGAFQGCSGLTTIIIPGSVTDLSWTVFLNCNNLGGVYFLGNAPSLTASTFQSGSGVTIYYLPGTSGWTAFDAISGVKPAVLWNAQVQTGDGNFGVRTNCFDFTITGTADIPIVVEACTNLASPTWTTLQSCCVTNGSIRFSDPQWTNHTTRFYHVRWP
jgi:BspA type Leucine rich repeat region (6 copies)/Concanavalin A-like lectin/glucanases superfamily